MDKDIYKAYEDSLKIGQCGLLKGTEDISAFCRLIFRPQGAKFMIRHSFPNMEIVRSLAKKYDMTKYGVYVDKGNIKIKNIENVCLFGNTNAEIECNLTENYKICVLQGAKAKVAADGFSVVSVLKDGLSEVKCTQLGNSKLFER